MFNVDAELLCRAVTKLDSLDISSTKLIQKQIVTIFTNVSEGSQMTTLNLSFNNLSELPLELLGKVVTKGSLQKKKSANFVTSCKLGLLTPPPPPIYDKQYYDKF